MDITDVIDCFHDVKPNAVTDKKSDIRLVTTTEIFDGINGNYTEEDKPNPINVYASKVIGGI